MKQNFNNSKEAINTIITSAQKHTYATDNGDYKTANKNYDLVVEAVDYLKKNNELDKLKDLITHNEISVKVAVASFLIKYSDPQAIAILEEIASKAIPHHSFTAQILLKQWNGKKIK
jgi:hypothetical protein